MIPVADSAHYGDINVTIGNEVTAKDGGTAASTNSAAEPLAGVEANVRSVRAERDDDDLEATWTANGSPALAHRIALLVEVATGTQQWLMVPADPAGGGSTGTITRNTTTRGSTWGRWTWELDVTADFSGTPWQVVGLPTGTTVAVTQTMLERALMLRVESQVDGDDWVMQTQSPVSIPAG